MFSVAKPLAKNGVKRLYKDILIPKQERPGDPTSAV
jgi:hypothetical protein